MSDRRKTPGKFIWFEHVSRDPRKAQAFFGEVFGWRTEAFPAGNDSDSYDMMYVGGEMIGGYAAPTSEGQRSHWRSYVSVEDVDSTAKVAAETGGKVLDRPFDAPGVGRMARISDPQGAELFLFSKAAGDPPDVKATHGHWVWNELHTSDPKQALAFYEKVLGFAHRSLDMGPDGTYHILSRGGTDRGGVSGHLAAGMASHWLPYVAVDDADAALGRARRLGGKVLMGPVNVPAAGRLAVFEDPTGATIALVTAQPAS